MSLASGGAMEKNMEDSSSSWTTRPARDPPQQTHPDIPPMDQILRDMDKDEYAAFDDYIEIVIQFGYGTLFASAYPLASVVSIFANWVEMRSDCYKMAHLCQRATVIRSSGLGMWRNLMASIIWMSALTNCLIVGFSSDQLMHYLPTFYYQDASGYTDMGHAKSWIVVFVIFGLERLLLVIGLFIHAMSLKCRKMSKMDWSDNIISK